jgi:hypothetical protein
MWMGGGASGTSAVARGIALVVTACGSTPPSSSSMITPLCCGTCWNAATSTPGQHMHSRVDVLQPCMLHACCQSLASEKSAGDMREATW